MLWAPPALATVQQQLLSQQYAELEAAFAALGGRSDRGALALALSLAQLTPAYREATQGWSSARPESPWPRLVSGLAEARRATALQEDQPLHLLPAARRRAVQLARQDAVAALEAALQRQPALGPAHAALLRLERDGARGMSARLLFERARTRAGASWSVLAAMLDAAVTETALARKPLEYLHGVARRAAGRHPDYAALLATADCALLQRAEYLDDEERREAIAAVNGVADSPHCQDWLALLAQSAGAQRDALRHARNAEALAADDGRRLQIAARLAALDGADAARTWLTQAIDQQGATPAALRRLASLHWQLGQDADAVRLLGLAVVWFPTDDSAWALRGQLLARDPSQGQAAAQSLATALTLNPASAELWAELLRLQLRQPCTPGLNAYAARCATSGCPDRVRRDPTLQALSRQLQRRCG